MNDDASTQQHWTADQSSPRLIPNVLMQLFEYVSPADSVDCLAAHWLLLSAANLQRHKRLAVPKNHMFSLKWPLCFHNREDSYDYQRQLRYIDLIRYNVSRKLPFAEVINQVRLFLAGYETMLLNEVYASAVQHESCYTYLNTLVVDFSLQIDPKLCTVEQICPFIVEKSARKPHVLVDEVKLDKFFDYQAGGLLLHLDWQRWARTITAITDTCGASLTNFVFTRTSFARNCSLAGQRKLSLPAPLYRALNFDKLLSEMRNLQTLYLTIGEYEDAFDDRKYKRRDAKTRHAWQLLHRTPQNERLPALQRIVVEKCFEVLNRQHQTMNPEYVLPEFSRSSSKILLQTISDEADEIYDYGKYSVFPHAETVPLYKDRSKLYISPVPLESENGEKRLKLLYVENIHPDVDGKGYDVATAQTNLFARKILKFVSGAKYSRERQQKLSVLSCLRMQETASVKARIELSIMGTANADANCSTDPSKTLEILLKLLQSRQINPSDVQIIISESKDLLDEGWNWSCMRRLLPLFMQAAAGSRKYDDDVLDTLRVDMNTYITTFGHEVEQWFEEAKNLGDGSDQQIFSQQKHFTFPKINLTAWSWIELHESEIVNNTVAESWIEAVERQALESVRVFLQDAVDSCTRRDMSFYMYQSLKRVRFVFRVWLEFDDKNATQLQKRIKSLLYSRAAKLEQRIVSEVFAEVLRGEMCENNGVVPPPTAVLNFKALRTIGTNFEFSLA